MIQDGVLDLDRVSGQSTMEKSPAVSWCNCRAKSQPTLRSRFGRRACWWKICLKLAKGGKEAESQVKPE